MVSFVFRKQALITLAGSVLVIFLAYIASQFLLTLYVGGDQVHYRALYEALSGASYSEVPSLGKTHVSSGEPISLYVLWLGASLGIDKNIYISSLNVILVLMLYLFMRKHKVNVLMMTMLMTSFYIIVLMTSAERLKIAYILLLFSTLMSGKMRIATATTAPFAHLQSFLLLPSAVLVIFSQEIKQLIYFLRVKKRSLILALFLSGMFLITFSFLFDSIFDKVVFYAAKDKSSFEIANLFFLSIIALFSTRDKFKMVLAVLPMYPAVIILGASRVNMIAVTVVLFLLIQERRLSHPLVFLLMLYFSLKSALFVWNIILYGDGFSSF